MKKHLVLLPCLFLAAGSAIAETVILDGTSIIGNRELPKALYIVPWKKAQPGQMVVRPFSSLYEQTLEPVDRDVLLRQLKYFKSAHHSTANKANPPLPKE